MSRAERARCTTAADVVVRPAIRHVPRSVVRDAHEQLVRCGLVIVPVSSETEDKFEDGMEVTASSPLVESPLCWFVTSAFALRCVESRSFAYTIRLARAVSSS
jgi:hypothetical protein